MNKPLHMIVSMLLAGFFVVQPARASIDAAQLYSTASIFNLVLLLCAIVCLAWSLKILSLVRGGVLSRSWQMFVLGFGFLLLAQVLILSERAELLQVPGFVATAFYLMMAITWLVGLYQTRKILG
ncbi:MAG: hypothetical protein JSV44_06415 [Candidatus Zixiibacteriota bacterium]|nr:MAG: hypothetical protein JSV44_06415 [candidate division Zixibacteria bacterium]